MLNKQLFILPSDTLCQRQRQTLHGEKSLLESPEYRTLLEYAPIAPSSCDRQEQKMTRDNIYRFLNMIIIIFT